MGVADTIVARSTRRDRGGEPKPVAVEAGGAPTALGHLLQARGVAEGAIGAGELCG